MKKSFLILFLIFAIGITVNFFNTDEVNAGTVSTSASGAILMEKTTNRILFEKNKDKQMSMASCTKILTAITVLDNCNKEEIVVIPKEAVGIEGSSIYLKANEELTVLELLYGLMLRSGNDCAVALALHVAGSLENFAEMMNQKAALIGAKNSNFVTPHGLDAKEHYTTPYDLALITCYALSNDTFCDIVSSKSAKIGSKEKDNYRILYNKNKLLNNFEFADGVKTGYTKKSGRCFVGSATKNGMQLVCVVLNCGPMFEETKKILEYGFVGYSLQTIVPANKIFKAEDAENVFFRCDENLKAVLKNDGSEINLIETTIEMNNTKDPELKIFFANKLLFSQKLSIIKR